MDEAEFRLVLKNKEESIDKLINQNLNFFKNFENLIVTQGKKGCYLKKNNQVFFVPCIINASIDSTGAGDIFLTMFFIARLFKKFSSLEAIILAHIAAGLHSNQLGNRLNYDCIDIYKILSSINK